MKTLYYHLRDQTMGYIRYTKKSALKADLIPGQFKIIWIFEDLHCDILFCLLSLTLGNVTIVTRTNDFQYFICICSTAQNIVFFY